MFVEAVCILYTWAMEMIATSELTSDLDAGVNLQCFNLPTVAAHLQAAFQPTSSFHTSQHWAVPPDTNYRR